MDMKYLLIFLFLLLVTPLYAQPEVIIEVCDTQGVPLAYPEILIGNYFHQMGGEQGRLSIPPESVHLNDTLTVRYLGYKPAKILLDASRLSRSPIKVSLEEESYLLEAVTVVSNRFSSEAYFQQRLKKSLRPYTRKHFFDLLFSFQDINPTSTYSGQVAGSMRRLNARIDTSRLIISEKRDTLSRLFAVLRRASEISLLVPHIICNKGRRSYFHCTYKGENHGLSVWEFSIKKQDNMRWDLKKEDELRCLVSLDKEGIISDIKTQFTPGAIDSISYLLETQFTLFKEKLVPAKVKMKLVPNTHNTNKSLSLTAEYRNHRKKE